MKRIQKCLHGGNTCAASPQSTTRPCDHLLQIRAEKRNGLDRRTRMQSSGNWMSCISLYKVSMFLVLLFGCLPISTPWVCDVRKDDFLNVLSIGHLLSILARKNHKLKAPESVGWWPKPTTYSGALRIANKPEVLWEKEVIHLLRSVSLLP